MKIAPINNQTKIRQHSGRTYLSKAHKKNISQLSFGNIAYANRTAKELLALDPNCIGLKKFINNHFIDMDELAVGDFIKELANGLKSNPDKDEIYELFDENYNEFIYEYRKRDDFFDRDCYNSKQFRIYPNYLFDKKLNLSLDSMKAIIKLIQDIPNALLSHDCIKVVKDDSGRVTEHNVDQFKRLADYLKNKADAVCIAGFVGFKDKAGNIDPVFVDKILEYPKADYLYTACMYPRLSELEKTYKELMQLAGDNEEAKKLIKTYRKYLHVDDIKNFISDFLKDMNNPKSYAKDKEYTKNDMIRYLNKKLNLFIYQREWNSRTELEKLNGYKIKCKYSDIKDKEGNITYNALKNAARLSEAHNSECYLPEYLNGAKDADGTIDYLVAEGVVNLIERLNDYHARNLMQSAKYRDKSGNVNRDLLNKIRNAANSADAWDVINHYGLKTKDEVFEEYSKKEGLCTPKIFYQFLMSLSKNRLIYSDDASILYEEIQDWDSPLFLLPKVVNAAKFGENQHENKIYIDKILQYLKLKDYEYDLNKQNTNGEYFMEYVIYSQNVELLDMVMNLKKKDLIWDPALDSAYREASDPEFIKKMKELDFKFVDLESAAELCSVIFLKKLSSQFESPFCDKEKMVLHLWDIAKNTKLNQNNKSEFANYLCDTYSDDISNATMKKLLNESAI